MPTFTTLVSLTDLAAVSPHLDGPENTPVLKAKAEARAKDYDAICCPLTTEKWRTRWRDMCILPVDGVPDKNPLEQRAEEWRSKPAFMRDEVTVTRLGTKFNLHKVYLFSDATYKDEAEGILAIVSDWLELDAPDSWVRHDSEIVRTVIYIQYARFPFNHRERHLLAYLGRRVPMVQNAN